jgi:predicted MFS family arabinose efflux permease
MAAALGANRIEPTSSRPWRVVGLLWFAFLINYVDRQVVYSIFPVLRSQLRFTEVQLGLIGSVFTWVYSVSMPLAGRLADLLPRRRMVIASLILWSLATLGTGSSGSAGVLLLWRAAMGVTEALYIPAALGLIAAVHGASTRSKALAIHATAQLAGIALGGWFGGWSAETIGWRNGFSVLAGVGLAYAVVLARALPGAPANLVESPKTPAAAWDIFRSRCYVMLAGVFFAFCAELWMLYAWLPDFIHSKFGLSLAESGFTATFYLQGGSAIGVLAGGAMADAVARRLRAGRFYTAGAGVFVSAPLAYATFASESLATMRLAALGFGAAAGLMIANVFAAAYDVITERNYGFGAGVLNFVGGLSGGASIFLTGLLKERFGVATLMAWAAAAAAAVAALMLAATSVWFEKDRQGLAGRQPGGGSAVPTSGR